MSTVPAVEKTKPFTGFDLKPYPARVLTEHIRYAMSLGLSEVTTLPAHDARIVIVASGPSIKDQLDRIRRYRKKGALIMAVKSAHDYLSERGIVPDIGVAMDPRPTIAEECYRLKNDSTIYILASQCHPETIQALLPNVTLCHPSTALVKELLGDEHELVEGGCTTGLRSLLLAYMLGYRDIRLFGFDSCHTSKGGLRKVTGESAEPWKPVEMQIDGKSYWTDEHFAQQVTEFPGVVFKMPDAKILAHGPGVIAQMLRGRK